MDKSQISDQLNRDLDAFGFSRSFTDYRRRAFSYLNRDHYDKYNDRKHVCVGSKRDALGPRSCTQSDLDILGIFGEKVFNDEKNQDKTKRRTTESVFVLEKTPYFGYKYLKVLGKTRKGDQDLFTPFGGCTYLLNSKKDLGNDFEVHGPAMRTTVSDRVGKKETRDELDLVQAFHCPVLPTDFDEWCNRKRNHQWPPNWIIETTRKHGCLVVGVGHPTSHTQPIEWRLSLVQTEHLLTKSFNHIQMKCYTLLRLVLKYIIQAHRTETLSSYHVKTVMFWMSEEREKAFWTPKNLYNCFMCSMEKLKFFVENRSCPNYFLTSVNLLDEKLEGNIYDDVMRILQNILEEGPRVVYKCVPLNVEINGAKCHHTKEESFELLRKHLRRKRKTEIEWLQHNLPCQVNPTENEDLFTRCHLGLTDRYVLNEIHNRSDFYSNTFSSLSVLEELNFQREQYSLQNKYLSDLRENEYVAQMKLATVLYYRRCDSCSPILSSAIKTMESSQEFELCSEGKTTVGFEKSEGNECIYLIQKNKGYNVSEIVFGPCDKCLLPFDLQDEMKRPKTVNGTYYEGWVFIDSIVYAHYLLILARHHERR